MVVRRIVPNLKTSDPTGCAEFYRRVFGLDVLMDMDWIVTMGERDTTSPLQLSLAREGGSGTDVPDLSIEVDDLDATLARAEAAGHAIEYGPVEEPWGVRRFYIRDPSGALLNVLTHQST